MAGQSRNCRAFFKRYLRSCPAVVRAMARTVKPWKTYRIVQTGQHCRVVAYAHGWTMRVRIVGHDNPVHAAIGGLIPMEVFGIKLRDLQLVSESVVKSRQR